MLSQLYKVRCMKIFKFKRKIHIKYKHNQKDVLCDNIEKIYQKKSLLEHILHRPDSYVGSLSKGRRNMFIYNTIDNRIIEKEISYSPALYKIYDEILVNAVDNKLRDDRTTFVKINVNKKKNTISISNNGAGIPVILHREENLYIPSLIFGHLLTSSNYDDSVDKFTGGRNGFGAKLCNLFSTEFTVETSNVKFGHSFKQTWRENMTKASVPIIESAKDVDFTTVTFSPDLSRFEMESLDCDIISLFHRRAVDIGSCTKNLSVYFNDILIPVKSFKDYVQLHQYNESNEIVHRIFNDNWEVVVTLSPNDTFNHKSFVNGINTSNGGQHVNFFTDQLVLKLHEYVKKKLKDTSNLIKPFHLKNCLWVFINCYIKNPTFESQSKEYLTLLPKHFGSTCDITDDFVKDVANCCVLKKLEAMLAIKSQELLDKGSGRRKNIGIEIEKLDDATLAGSKHSKQCTLILTEGDSAKTLALSGLSVIGRDYYGVYPLKGKLLNVRDADVKKISENNEFSNLVKIMGLKYNKQYSTTQSLDSLRYGRIMIMADQDPDGSHIKGLLINYFHFYWPELLKHGLLEQFITPLIKAFRNNVTKTFFSENEYNQWQEMTPDSYKWRIKYYKGLGTSTSSEAKEYFTNIDRHRIPFISSELDDKKIKMAFDKKRSHERKLWLLNWMEQRKENKERKLNEEDIYKESVVSISFSDFVDKELIQYSNADNERSIPSLMDGLKIGQRKIIYTCLKRNLTKEIKVAQLAGSVAEISSYHHGESALNDTIIGLAQDYLGSNNINLLKPVGQFGTRVYGGKDAASARYIFTQLSSLTRLIFHPMDDPILGYLSDNNQIIEPEWYAPVIPLILVNGCEGIGTGWRSIIPNFNPLTVIENLRRMLEDKEPLNMDPWYRNFTGKIEKISPTQYVSCGKIESIGADKLLISELPVKCWTQWYKVEVLNKLSQGDHGFVRKYEEHSTDTTVKIIVHMNPSLIEEAKSLGLKKVFKLKNYISSNEMILFDELGRIKKFDSPEDILTNFFRARLPIYDKRKAYIERLLTAEYKKLENQSRFIQEHIEKKISIENVKENILKHTLVRKKYDSDPVKEWKKITSLIQNEDERSSDVEIDEPSCTFDFNYLINLPLRSLTEDNVAILKKEKKSKFEELKIIENKTSRQLWFEDLRDLELKIKEIYF